MDFNLFSTEGPYQEEEEDRSPDQPQDVDVEETPGGQPVGGGEPTRPSRRSRRNPNQEPRPRGRPRLHTRDETAAERRRTQIRLAQRAYRQRKETTITALKRKVEGLEQTIQGMNQAVLNFNDRAMASSIEQWDPELAARLRTLVEEVGDLANEALRTSDAESDDNDNDNDNEEDLESPGVGTEPTESPLDVQADIQTPTAPPWGIEARLPPNPAYENPPWATDPGQPFLQLQAEPSLNYPDETMFDPNDPEQNPFNEGPFQFYALFPPQTLPQDVELASNHMVKPLRSLPLPHALAPHQPTCAQRLKHESVERGLQDLHMNPCPTSEAPTQFKLAFYFSNHIDASHVMSDPSPQNLPSEGSEYLCGLQSSADGSSAVYCYGHIIDSISQPSPKPLPSIDSETPLPLHGAEEFKYVEWSIDDMKTVMNPGGGWFI